MRRGPGGGRGVGSRGRSGDAGRAARGCEHVRPSNADARSFGAERGEGSLGFGAQAVAALAQLPEADVVVNALVGAAGLRASYDTLRAGKVLALANKESLVVGGDSSCRCRPSGRPPSRGRHGPCARPRRRAHAHRFGARRHLPMPHRRGRARGGALVGYRVGRPLPRAHARAAGGRHGGRGACASHVEHGREDHHRLVHPDDKGLEVIEAHHLFAMPYDRISVVVQPQSAIHSMWSSPMAA